MLQVITSQIDPELGKSLKLASVNLHESMRKNRSEMIVAADNLKQITDKLINKFEAYEFSNSDMKTMFNTIVANSIKGEYIDYMGREESS